ncbi:MAG: protein kinase [Sandaracinaceae bacterium]|nr:protein kinase [Sandaracinaceae bacterium]
MAALGVIDGRFRLEAQIATGGMGRVYRAVDAQTGRSVALKVIAGTLEAADERFRREATTLARLRHPALVEHVAHGVAADGEAYLAMEWLEGRDLRAKLGGQRDATLPEDARSRFPIADVVALGRRIAAALGELHRHGVVHRDVKPGNVFCVNDDLREAKLLDLGAVTIADADRLTRTGLLVGTPAYMAPEQVRAEEAATPAADVWSLGAVLYECITGRPAFRAQHMVAVLAKIVLDEPPSLAAARQDLPAALVRTLERCLVKDPAARIADGDALAAALEEVEVRAPERPSIAPATASIGAAERRVRCVVVGSLPPGLADRVGELDRAAARAGGTLARLAPGSFVVTVEPPGAPMDQSARAGRVALALRHAAPEVALAIGLGPAESDGHVPVGDAVDRAAALLQATVSGEVRVEPATVPLLEARFDLSLGGAEIRLLGERPEEAARTLLGRPTAPVGRRRELGLLTSTWEHTVDEPASSVVLVTATPGMGKSRLRYELLRELRRRGEPLTLLEGHGDALGAGSPFGVLAPAIRRWAGAREGDAAERVQAALHAKLARRLARDPATLERIFRFLAELVGAPVDAPDDEALAAARQDPMLLGEATKRAFADWLHAETEAQPVLVLLEDLHWGDLPSIKFVEAALARCPERPLMVLALARPEVHDRFPELFREHATQEVRLGALSKSASLQLVRQVLGDSIDDATAERIAAHAGGNAFHLEELIRATAEGAGALPESVLAMVQSRLDALGPEAKRVLRAAAVFGETFWTGGVEALLGDSAVRVDAWLEDLAAREVVTARPSGRFDAEREWRFRHALVRDGAYELLTGEDRVLGHRLAGAWLRAAGEPDALVLAEHFDRGGAPREAAQCLLRAAEQALEGNDLDAALARVERASATGALEPAERGALLAIESLARYWKSDYAGARRAGDAAAALLAPGSRGLYRALGSATVASARLGDFAAVDASFARILESEPSADAAGERLVALARGTFQLVFAGRFDDADRALARIGALATDEAALEPLPLAQIHHVRGVRACMVGDVATFFRHLAPAVDAFERAGDVRNASLERTTLAWCHAELGDFARAAALAEDNLARCEAMAAPQAITYAKVNLGYILTHLPGGRARARATLEAAISECRAAGNPRLGGWALAHLAALERLEGAGEREEAAAREACRLLTGSPSLEAWALARHALALVDLGRAPEALPLAERAMATLERLGGLIQGDAVVPLALARARAALGEDARAILADAAARLERRAARIEREDWRAGFLAHPERRALCEVS